MARQILDTFRLRWFEHAKSKKGHRKISLPFRMFVNYALHKGSTPHPLGLIRPIYLDLSIFGYSVRKSKHQLQHSVKRLLLFLENLQLSGPKSGGDTRRCEAVS